MSGGRRVGIVAYNLEEWGRAVMRSLRHPEGKRRLAGKPANTALRRRERREAKRLSRPAFVPGEEGYAARASPLPEVPRCAFAPASRKLATTLRTGSGHPLRAIFRRDFSGRPAA